jgi:shikimate dehydrogenase
MIMSSETKIFAVTGRPILHSKSPNMFNAVFEHDGTDAAYIRLAAKNAEQAIFLFKSLGISGMNVTAPYKEKIKKYIDVVHDEAKILGSINTIVNKDGILHGYNTDYFGVTESFVDAGISVEGKRCLVVGAGGAGKAAAYGLHKKGAKVTIINRTYSKSKNAAKIIGCKATEIFNIEEKIKKADIIISTLKQNVNPIKPEWLTAKQVIFDANYKGSLLLPIAKEKGCIVVSAEDWLLNQAVLAYELFLDTKPNKEIMKQGLSLPSLSLKKNTISTIGLMGAGKTSHGKVLASKLRYEFKDTDDAIVAKQQMPITQIFEKQGEAYFRNLEKEELSESFNSKTPYVLSCGGGIVVNETNRKILKDNSIVVWLFASPEAIIARTDISKRPLLQVANPLEKLKELLHARKGMYAKTAHIVVSTERKMKGHNTNRIISELESI